jgi:hypothetical protein
MPVTARRSSSAVGPVSRNSATIRSIASVATAESSPGFSTTERSTTLASSNGVTPMLTELATCRS